MKTFVLLLFMVHLVVAQKTHDTRGTTLSKDANESQNKLWKTHLSGKNVDFECDVPWRLPRNILPIHYNITLRIDPNNTFFNGSVWIDIKCVEKTDRITLHSRELNISTESISVKRKSGIGPNIIFTNISVDDEHEMIHIQLESHLEKGNYVLSFPDFIGKIQENDNGLFIRTYEVKNNETNSTRRLIASQLEPTFARMVFPCFDEPSMKTTFAVRIEHPFAYKSFSNMPMSSSTQVAQDRVLDTFEESVLLPTYAMAFLVADYSRYPDSKIGRTNILVPEQDIDKVDFAYRLAANALLELEKYTKIPYPVSKVDHASIPNFTSEAMENWGLILYEKCFLVDDWKTPTLTRQQGLSLIPHELSHQWFGNMVTTDWWSYLWLNEGFATFFQYYISNKILPNWQFWDQFIVHRLQEAMIEDAKIEDPALAMTSRRCTRREIQETFNGISYNKGASILKMIKFILGEDEFQGAIRLYLQRRSMKNAKPADWFQVLDDVNVKLNDSPLPKNVTFKELGADWTEQAGFPVITVTRDYTSSGVFIQQERFFDKRSKNLSVENQDNRWWIPLTWTSTSFSRNPPTRPQDWLYDDRSVRVYVPKDDWLLFNTNAEGFYRVNYDQRNWDLIIQGLERFPKDFSVANRMQLIDDAFTLGFAHRLNLGTALSISRFLQNEDDVVVWMSANRQFDNLYKLMGSIPAYPKLEKYLQNLMRETYRRVRLDITAQEPQMDKILREHLAPVACAFGLDLCLIDAHFALWQFLADVMLEDERSASENLHPDIWWTVLCGGTQSGGETLFKEVRSLAVNTSIESSKRHLYLSALSCTKDFDVLLRHLEDVFNNNTLLNDDQALEAVTLVLENQRSMYTGYQFVRNNVNKINHYYNCSTKYTENLVRQIIENIRTTTFYDEIRQWIISSNGDELGNKTALLEYLESRKAGVEWSSESVQQVSDWLNTPGTTLPQPIVGSRGSTSAGVSLMLLLVTYLFLYLQTAS